MEPLKLKDFINKMNSENEDYCIIISLAKDADGRALGWYINAKKRLSVFKNVKVDNFSDNEDGYYVIATGEKPKLFGSLGKILKILQSANIECFEVNI